LAVTPPASSAAAGDARAPKPGPKIYKYLKGGTPSFSDVPPAKIPYVIFTPSCYACNVHSNINWHTTPLHLDAYADDIAAAARQFSVARPVCWEWATPWSRVTTYGAERNTWLSS
jgi:hypothetical protein